MFRIKIKRRETQGWDWTDWDGRINNRTIKKTNVKSNQDIKEPKVYNFSSDYGVAKNKELFIK